MVSENFSSNIGVLYSSVNDYCLDLSSGISKGKQNLKEREARLMEL